MVPLGGGFYDPYDAYGYDPCFDEFEDWMDEDYGDDEPAEKRFVDPDPVDLKVEARHVVGVTACPGCIACKPPVPICETSLFSFPSDYVDPITRISCDYKPKPEGEATMGHHIDDQGRFQSDKHPDLPPDRVRINIEKPHNWPGLLLIADAYQDIDAEFAYDLRNRICGLRDQIPTPTADVPGYREQSASPDLCETEGDAPDFRSELSELLNKHSKESSSNTPDWILRDYLCGALKAFNLATNARDGWYGKEAVSACKGPA